MREPLPLVLIPGLLCSPRLYVEQLPQLWRFGSLFVVDHTRDDAVAASARRILAASPPRFALVGLSMGGYIAFEIIRVSPDRVARLALLDTSARPDMPEQSDRRRAQIALAHSGRFAEVIEQLFTSWVCRARRNDESLRRIVQRMAEETGPEAFTRQPNGNHDASRLAAEPRPDSVSDPGPGGRRRRGDAA